MRHSVFLRHGHVILREASSVLEYCSMATCAHPVSVGIFCSCSRLRILLYCMHFPCMAMIRSHCELHRLWIQKWGLVIHSSHLNHSPDCLMVAGSCLLLGGRRTRAVDRQWLTSHLHGHDVGEFRACQGHALDSEVNWAVGHV